jgi:hypothetical protein
MGELMNHDRPKWLHCRKDEMGELVADFRFQSASALQILIHNRGNLFETSFNLFIYCGFCHVQYVLNGLQ